MHGASAPLAGRPGQHAEKGHQACAQYDRVELARL